MKRLKIDSSWPDAPEVGSNMLECVNIPVLFVDEVLSDVFPVQCWKSPEPRNVPLAEIGRK